MKTGGNPRLMAAMAALVGMILLICGVAQIYWAAPPVPCWGAGAVLSLAAVGALFLVSRECMDRRLLIEGLHRVQNEEAVDFTELLGGGEAPAALQDLANGLAHNKALANGILEGLPMAFLLVDTEERALFTNQHTLDMLQIDGKVENQLGHTLAEIFYNDPKRETAVGKAMHKGQVFRNLEVEIKGHKGGVRHVLANVYALKDKRKKVFGGVCLYIDMTALKEKEEEIREHNEMITRIAGQADVISDQLAAASEEISSQVELSSQASEDTRKLAAEVATAVEQMNATVLEVARNASSTADLSDNARTQAEKGAQIVTAAIEGIASLETQANRLATDMDGLGKQAESIGGIMGVITDIADQTNLLALNAAIEAARAGDAGRGFAVVADEVRKLAEKTMEATKNVEGNISAIQRSAEANVATTRATVKVVGETVDTTRRAGEALSEIVELSAQTSANIQSIATAAEEQSAASEEISRSTGEINEVASGTSQAMHESAQAVGDLARLAGELRRVMDDMRD
jgi:methyl-accepting chemotaxis protein